MGLTNNIGTKEDIKCLKCGKSLRYDTDHPVLKDTIFFQSKDLADRGHQWMVGDKITLYDYEGSNFRFVAEGDDVWTGCHVCPHCRTFFECDIIIKNGTIKEIKNLKYHK